MEANVVPWTWLGSFLYQSPKIAVFATFGAGMAIYYLYEVVKRPIFVCRVNSQWDTFLRRHLLILQEKYWPTPWCFESRAQTILASLLRSRLPNIKYKRDIVQLQDGGEVSLDWVESQHGDNRSDAARNVTAIVVLLPGLTGHSQSEYIKNLVVCTQINGAQCVVFNNRGRGGIKLKTARTYCAANSDDFEEVLRHIKKKYPSSKIVATGISLGGMILGNFLATRGVKAANFLEAAMAISIPWNIFVGTESLEKPIWNLLLNRHLAQCLCDSVRHMQYALRGNHPWDLDFVLKSKTIREFDSRFTAVQFGFRDVDDYYRSACLHDKLDSIKVPLLCLSAADDPFQPFEGIPIEAAKKSSHVAIVVTYRGGHIGFMEGLLPISTYYSDRLYTQLLHGIFTNPPSMNLVKEECDTYAQENENKCRPSHFY